MYLRYNEFISPQISLEEDWKLFELKGVEFLLDRSEDFFLDNQVNYNEVKRCKNFLESSDYSFVRLLKVMLEGAIHRPELKMKSFDDIINGTEKLVNSGTQTNN